MTRRDPRENGTRQCGFAMDRLAGGNSCQRSGRRHSEVVHRFAENVLAKYRAEPRLAITTSRIWRAPRSLELNVMTHAGIGDDFTDQGRTAIPELWNEVSELVAGVGQCYWLDTREPAGTAEYSGKLGVIMGERVETEFIGQFGIPRQLRGCCHLIRHDLHVEGLGQPRIAVVEVHVRSRQTARRARLPRGHSGK